MTIRSFTFNPFQTNCYVCHDEETGVVVDPSCATPAEVARVVGYVKDQGLSIDRLLLTHAHLDHILGCAALAEQFGAPVYVHRDDLALLTRGADQAALFGLELRPPPEPAGFLDDGDHLSIAGRDWEVLHTPGHSPGSVSFYIAEDGVVLGGDVLFAGSIGRTDLWQGSLPVLMRTIFGRLIPLGDETRVLPGHGPETTVGKERTSNPFLLDGHG